jgi:hypothetical protein
MFIDGSTVRIIAREALPSLYLDPAVAWLIADELQARYRVYPLCLHDGCLVVTIAGTPTPACYTDLRRATGYDILFTQVDIEELADLLR